jgi:hypothetical protein
VISFKAPDLCQGADEDLLVGMGEIVFPGFVTRHQGENGLRLWVDGTAPYDASRTKAVAQFQTLLGVLRAWRSGAGQLVEEARGGLGQGGATRDSDGRQWITVGPAIVYTIVGGDDRRYAEEVSLAINKSQDLRVALWLNGQTNRTAAELYMIYGCAHRDLGGQTGITAKLGISRNQQETFTRSANNLSPLEGGRHVEQHRQAPWTLVEQQEFTDGMLRRWISYLARN